MGNESSGIEGNQVKYILLSSIIDLIYKLSSLSIDNELSLEYRNNVSTILNILRVKINSIENHLSIYYYDSRFMIDLTIEQWRLISNIQHSQPLCC